MYKRGQVTIFIILGIIILLMAGLFFVFMEKKATDKLSIEQETSLAPKVSSVKSFIESCLEHTTREAIFFTSEQGGYYSTPAPYYEFAFFDIPYYFDQKILIVPNKEMIEKEIGDYVEANIPECFDEFETFQGEVSAGDSSVKVTIGENSVISVLNTEVTIIAGDAITYLNTFAVIISVELGQALELRDRILEEQEKYPNAVRMSELAQMHQEYKVLIDLANVEDMVIYKIQFPDSLYDPSGYIYTFGMKYNWSNNQLNLK